MKPEIREKALSIEKRKWQTFHFPRFPHSVAVAYEYLAHSSPSAKGEGGHTRILPSFRPAENRKEARGSVSRPACCGGDANSKWIKTNELFTRMDVAEPNAKPCKHRLCAHPHDVGHAAIEKTKPRTGITKQARFLESETRLRRDRIRLSSCCLSSRA